MSRAVSWTAGAALIAVPFIYHDAYPLHILVLILIWSLVYTSWSIMGCYGLVSLGHGGFMGIGAYVTALSWNYFHLSPWLGIPLAMSSAALVAALIGYPCFRFRITGHYFALLTLALSAIVLQVITATRDFTGGSLGYTPERYHGGSSILAVQFLDKTTWYLIALGVWAAGLLIRYRIDHSMLRYALEAIAEDEDAAAAAGVHVTLEKLKITVLSAAMTAFAGPLGPTVGAAITILLSESLRIWFGTTAVGWDNVVYGALLVVFIIFLPQGLLGSLLARLRLARRLA
jgi:branched-chain amino acid transport system permease protein